MSELAVLAEIRPNVLNGVDEKLVELDLVERYQLDYQRVKNIGLTPKSLDCLYTIYYHLRDDCTKFPSAD